MASKRKAQKDREAQVRWDLIDPVLDLLGYDRAHVTVEHACHSLSTGGAGRPPAPDYVVWLSTSEPEQVPPNAAFVLEAKAADEEVGEPVLAQAAGYANAPEIDADLIVLSNGRKLDVYERAAGEWEQRFARSVGELLRGSPALKTLRDIVGLSALAPGYAEDLGRYRRHGWEDVPSLLGGALLARDGVLDRVCDRCARPGVVGVQGPIGVGKSAFMWAVAERCLAARFRFDDQEPTVDDTLITLAYQTVVRWLGPGQMDDVRRAIGAPGAYELARSKLYDAAAHAASVPVVVIDSIDRADGGTRDLLTRLVTHTRDRIAWVVSARDGTLPVVVDEPVVQIVPLPPQDARRIWNQHREEGAWDPLDERLPRLPLLLGILIREQPRTEGEYQQRVRESVDETYQAWWERLSDEERELALHAAFSPGGAPLLEDLCGVTATKQVPEGDPLVENALKAQVPALAAVSRHVPDHFLWVHRSAQEFVQRQAGRYESQYRERWVAWAQRECAAGRRGGDLLWDSLVAAREDSGATGQVREWLRRADSDPSVPSMLSSVLRRLASLDPELGERVAQVLVDSPQSTADDRVAGVGHLVGLAADSDGARQRDLLLAKALPVLAGLAETHGRATGDCGYAREALADQLNDLAERGDPTPRAAAIERIVSALRAGDDIRPAAWLAGAVGCRSDRLADALRAALDDGDRPPEQRDVAASVLADLGLGSKGLAPIVEYVAARASGSPSVALLHAIVGTDAMDAAERLWRALDRRDEQGADDQPGTRQALRATQVLPAWLADRRWWDAGTQGHMWRLVTERTARAGAPTHRELSGMGQIAHSIDSPGVVPCWLSSVEVETDPAHRQRCYATLEGCVRPAHLASWAAMRGGGIPPIVRSDAAALTSQDGLGDHSAPRLRYLALDVLFRAGEVPGAAVIGAALADNSDESVCEALCAMLACLCLGRLPEPLPRWITTPHDEGGDGPSQAAAPSYWLLPRLAEEVAGNAGCRGAFDALLVSGYTLGGHPQQDTADALACVAQTLLIDGHTGVVEALFDVVEAAGAERRHRLVAAEALEQLAWDRRLSPEHFERALRLIDDTEPDEASLPEFCRAKLVCALCVVLLGEGDLADRVADLVSRIANGGAEGSVYWEAIEGLAQTRGLAVCPRVLADTLGLRQDGVVWTLPDGVPWEAGTVHAHLLGLAFVHDCDALLPATLTVVREASGEVLHDLLTVVSDERRRGRLTHLSDEFATTLRERAFAPDPWEDSLAHHLRLIDPDVFASAPWGDHWGPWHPSAAADLLDEISRLGPRPLEVGGTLLATILAGIGAGTYEVRRSAYRALAALDQARLRSLVERWQESDSIPVRKRAAEACCWLDPADPSSHVDPATWERAAGDAEGRVREAAERCLTERRNRIWSRDYLARVLAVTTNSNEDLLAAWPYGEALGHLGDDETMHEIWNIAPGTYLPPNVRHWRKRIYDAVEKHWKQVQDKWPKPWFECEMPGL